MITLDTKGASLVLEKREGAAPLWRHLGARVDAAGVPGLGELRAAATYSMDQDKPLDVFPTAGLGSFAPPALALRDEAGHAIDVQFGDAQVVVDDDALTIALSDPVSSIAATVKITAKAGGGIVFASDVTNRSDAPVMVDRMVSATLPLPAISDQIISWRGRHNAELVECAEAMPQHGWVRETRRGLTGHGGPCGAYVLTQDAGYDAGLTFALQLAWSGDSRLTIERDDEGFWVMQAEALLQAGEARLAPGESLAAPEALLAISTGGRNGAMAQMHALVRDLVAWTNSEMPPRPVHLNSWEACYFAHDEARILALAEAAREIGIERFIIDDGWFRNRNNDRAGLGDWTPDPAKYPDGLAPVAHKVRAMGMEFGLWVEPEMVNPDSDLYRADPDWALHLPKRDRPTARGQFVLDMRREDVRDYLFECLDTLLVSAPISYLKWDHNRDHAPSGGAAQTRGSYALMERLRAAHPHVEIESCAGGGGRIDAGIARYVQRFWTSDNIDALARVPIQRGFLAWMPPEMMGAHVGASPSHATGRQQSLAFRAAIACQGHLGVELDPAGMAASDRKELCDWIAFYKKWRRVIHGGAVHLGKANDGVLWQAQGTGDEMLLWVIRRDHGEDRRSQPIALPFAENRDWGVTLLKAAVSNGVLTPRSAPAFKAMRDAPQGFSGSWLANAGLPVPALPAESALIFHLKAV